MQLNDALLSCLKSAEAFKAVGHVSAGPEHKEPGTLFEVPSANGATIIYRDREGWLMDMWIIGGHRISPVDQSDEVQEACSDLMAAVIQCERAGKIVVSLDLPESSRSLLS